MVNSHKTGAVVALLLMNQDLYITDNLSKKYFLFVYEKYNDIKF